MLFSAACTNGGTNQWTTTSDVHVLNGIEQASAQTLDACRQICLNTAACNAIDYNANATGVKCWIFNNLQNPELLPETGVVHEALERCAITTTTVSTPTSKFTFMKDSSFIILKYCPFHIK